eukprot:403372676
MTDTRSGAKKLSRAQEKAKSYIDEHQIEKTIAEMLNSLVHARDPKPTIFMIKYLANLVTEQELEEYGIKVTGPVPQRIPIINYPKFEEDCNSLLKKHLTREVWSNMKKKNTSKGGNIQMCVKSGVQNPNCEIGVMATDEEAYKQFNDLFGPIIKDLHPKFDNRYSYQFGDLHIDHFNEKLNEMQDALEKIKHFKISARRNFKGTPFSPLMTREAKLQVERKIVEVLGELYGQYTQLARLDEKEKSWMTSQGISVERDPEHDAAGINDDWPTGRGVFIHDQRSFVVLVNFEDHLEIIILPEKNNQKDSIKDGLQRMIKLLQTFEKLGYATDPYLGNLTASPKNLGTALKLEVDFIFENKIDHNIDKEVNDEITYGKNISIVNRLSDGKHADIKLVSEQTLGPQYTENIQIMQFLESVQSLNSIDYKPSQKHQVHNDYVSGHNTAGQLHQDQDHQNTNDGHITQQKHDHHDQDINNQDQDNQ